MSTSKIFSPFQRLKSMFRIFQKRGIIIPMFKDVFKGNYKMPFARMALLILAIAYMIWPIDLVPDFIIGLGWIDDLIVFAWVSKLFEEELLKYQHHKNFDSGKPVILESRWK